MARHPGRPAGRGAARRERRAAAACSGEKLRRKRDGWRGSPLGDRVHVLEEPWATLTLADEDAPRGARREDPRARGRRRGHRARSPARDARGRHDRRRSATSWRSSTTSAAAPAAPSTFVLVHHENKGGKVSGAWEGVGDTLLHVQGQGHGRTRLYVQKARWSSSHHATSLQLVWTDGEGFEVEDKPELDDDTIADDDPRGRARRTAAHRGTRSRRSVAGQARAEGARSATGCSPAARLINAGGKAGMKLWHADDPACPVTPEQLVPVPEPLREPPGSARGRRSGVQPDRFPPYREPGHREPPGSPAQPETLFGAVLSDDNNPGPGDLRIVPPEEPA